MRSTQPRTTLYLNRSTGYYHINIRWPDGARSRPSLRVRTEPEARVAYTIFLEEVLPALIEERQPAAYSLQPAPSPSPRIHDLINWFINTHLPYLGRATKTIVHYERVLRDFQTFCSQRHIGRTQQLSTRVIQEWQLWLSEFRRNSDASQLSKASSAAQRKTFRRNSSVSKSVSGSPSKSVSVSRRDELLTLRHFLDEAAEAGELDHVPPITWNIPKKSRSTEFRAVPAPELNHFLNALLEHSPGRLYPPIAWMAYSGWRPSDVLDLRWSEIHDTHVDRAQLKTQRGLLYPLSPPLLQILQSLSKSVSKSVSVSPFTPSHPSYLPSSHVFLDRGRPWTYQQFKKQLEYLIRRHNLPNIRPRDLRKTFATTMANAGCPPTVLKELLGHNDVALTLTYYVEVDLPTMANWAAKLPKLLDPNPGH